MAHKVRSTNPKRSAPRRKPEHKPARKPVQSKAARAKRMRAFSADVASLDYANSRAVANPVRKFKDTVPTISPEELDLVYRFSGLVRKGINKKARDALRRGLRIVTDDEDREDAEELNATAKDWMRATAYVPKAIKALREMFVRGDGFLELGYDKAKDTQSSTAPPESAVPVAVYNVAPDNILPVKNARGVIVWYLSGPNVREVNREVIKAWEAGKEGATLPRDIVVIHPKRIQHFEGISIGDDPDGLNFSVIEAAYISLLAKLAGDNSAGDILEWYSKGFYTISTEYASVEELQAKMAQLDAAKKARKNYFVSDERTTFDIKSPTTPNVSQFYDNFYLEIAAALEMPMMVLTGVQKGTVTGSGTDLVEYYDDVHAFQSLLLEAPMLEMMRRVLKRNDISIEFNQLFVDKQTEADIMFKHSQAGSGAFGSGWLTKRQTVRWLRDGDLPNPDEVPDEYVAKPVKPGFPEVEDDPEEEELASESSIAAVLPLVDADRAQIAALAARERALGQKILADWEDDNA